MKKLWYRLRFGKIRREVKDSVAGIVAEVAYFSRGKIVGYWAYGYFDPSLLINEDTYKYIYFAD